MEDQNPFQVRDVRHEANVRVMDGWMGGWMKVAGVGSV